LAYINHVFLEAHTDVCDWKAHEHMELENETVSFRVPVTTVQALRCIDRLLLAHWREGGAQYECGGAGE